MKMITSKEEYDGMSGKDVVRLQCEVCDILFTRTKRVLRTSMLRGGLRTCSQICARSLTKGSPLRFECKNCSKELFIQPGVIRSAKNKGLNGKNFLCSNI